MTNLEKYHDILRRYRAGEFGEEYLSLHDILSRAGEPFLLQEMTADELTALYAESSSPALKAFFVRLRDLNACGS